jgi:hypothetical protein
MSRSEKMPILQINFKLNVSPAEYRKMCQSMAQTIAAVPGLIWKVWLLNEQLGEAGGIYLFRDEQSLAAYLSSPIITQIKSLPQLREMSAKRFETMRDVTAASSGPIPALTTAYADEKEK